MSRTMGKNRKKNMVAAISEDDDLVCGSACRDDLVKSVQIDVLKQTASSLALELQLVQQQHELQQQQHLHMQQKQQQQQQLHSMPWPALLLALVAVSVTLYWFVSLKRRRHDREQSDIKREIECAKSDAKTAMACAFANEAFTMPGGLQHLFGMSDEPVAPLSPISDEHAKESNEIYQRIANAAHAQACRSHTSTAAPRTSSSSSSEPKQSHVLLVPVWKKY